MEIGKVGVGARIPSPLLRQTMYRFYAGLLLYPEPERIEKLKTAAQGLAEQPSPHSSPRRVESSTFQGEGVRRTGGGAAGIASAVLSLNGHLADLQSDYVRLFRSSPHDFCYPYEGAYMDPSQAGFLGFRLECEYAQAGLQLAVKDFPDFAATELEFMSYLCGRQLALAESKASHEPRVTSRELAWQRRQLAFLNHHLARWFPEFARLVAVSGCEFYALVCASACEWIRGEVNCLESELREPIVG